MGHGAAFQIYRKPALGVQVEYIYRVSLRRLFKMTNVFPDDQTYKFSTTFYEIGEMAEFNFFSYGMGESYRKLKRFTPYITAGLGMTMWSVDSNFERAFTIPLGIGFKYKPSLRLNFGTSFL